MTEACQPTIDVGLRGIVVASTRISKVDGAAGKLIYRGYLVKDLAESSTYEEIVFLLLYEKLPDGNELAAFKKQLAAERPLPEEVLATLKTFPQAARPMDVIQAATAALAHADPDTGQPDRAAYLRVAIRLVARLATLVATWHRIRAGLEVIQPREDLGHAANFLYMLSGEIPDDELARYFDVCLILHAEHSFNASTFTARQIASTHAHMYASVAGAIGSLSGELHGGANVRVMEMLMKIGSLDQVETFVQQELDAGRVIFGLGHAVYQVDDPRAHILAPMSKALGRRVGQPQWYEISRALEKAGKAAFKARKGVDIFVNVDFYSASLYSAMGIAIDLFTPVFAVARIAGWAAHVVEERFGEAAEKPALYRPKSLYTGDYCGPDECAYVPVDDR